MENIFRNKEVNDSFNRWLNTAPFSENGCDRRRRYEFYVVLLKHDESFNEEKLYDILKEKRVQIDAKKMAKQMIDEFLLIDDFFYLCELNSKLNLYENSN